jgi:hypothetical protein
MRAAGLFAQRGASDEQRRGGHAGPGGVAPPRVGAVLLAERHVLADGAGHRLVSYHLWRDRRLALTERRMTAAWP